MKLDRELQLEILKHLREHHPSYVVTAEPGFPQYDNDNIRGNLIYLREHGLIGGEIKKRNGMPHTVLSTCITAKGLDFLEADGGIDAILRTITVRFNPDDIRAIIEEKINTSELQPAEKIAISKTVKNLSTEALKTVVQRLINEGISKTPDFLQWLQALG